MRSRARYWLAGTASVALVTSVVVAGPTASGAATGTAADAALVTVDPGVKYQNIDGWGTSLAWWAETTGGWSSDEKKNQLADAIFSPTKGLGLNIVRYDIGARGVFDLCAAGQRTGAAIGSFEPAPGSWDWGQDPNQRWMLQAAKARGANHFEAIAYSAPSWMTIDDCSSGSASPFGADNLSIANYGRYTNYLATVVKHFHDDWGITFDTVDPFNEPVQTIWRFGGNQQGMNLSRASQNALIGILGQSLSSSGAAGYTAISAPDEQSVVGAYQDLQSYSATSRAALAQFNAHDYKAGQDESQLYRLGQETGKPIWMSEWGNNGAVDDPGDAASDASSLNSAIQLSQQILLNEQQLHPSAWSIWQAADGGAAGDGNCTDLWGLVCTNIEPGAVEDFSLPKRYYAMGNYSEFVRPGYQMIDDSDPNTFTAYDDDTDSLVLVVTNPDHSASRDVTYDVSGVPGMDSALATPHLTDLTHNLTEGSGVAVSNGKFSVTLPPRSVTTYVLRSAGGAGASKGKLAAVQFGQQVQIFGRGTDGHAYSDVWTDGKGWSDWQNLGGDFVGDLSAVPYGQRMQVFGRGTDNQAYTREWTEGSGWSDWQALGGQLVGDLSAVQFGQQVQIFGRGTDGHAFSDVWTDGEGWSGWRDLGGELVGDLSAVRFGQQMEVFGRGTDGHAFSDVWTDGEGWSGWRDLGGEPVGDLSAVRFGQQMEVFGRGTDGHAFSDVWTDGEGWSGWRDLGGELVDDVSAVRFGQQMEVFGRGTDGHAFSDVWTDGEGWSGWRDLGEELAGEVSATQYGSDQIHVFGVAANGNAHTDVYVVGGTWSGWQNLGGTLS